MSFHSMELPICDGRKVVPVSFVVRLAVSIVTLRKLTILLREKYVSYVTEMNSTPIGYVQVQQAFSALFSWSQSMCFPVQDAEFLAVSASLRVVDKDLFFPPIQNLVETVEEVVIFCSVYLQLLLSEFSEIGLAETARGSNEGKRRCDLDHYGNARLRTLWSVIIRNFETKTAKRPLFEFKNIDEAAREAVDAWLKHADVQPELSLFQIRETAQMKRKREREQQREESAKQDEEENRILLS